LQSLQIKDYSQVKKLNGTKQGGNYALVCLMFSTKDGTQLSKVGTYAGAPYDTDFKIEDSEEIIGIYGAANIQYISSLGFLVWQPPRF
jgi:hypothetical protein